MSDERHPRLPDTARQLLAELAGAEKHMLNSKGRTADARELVTRGLAHGKPGGRIGLTLAGAFCQRHHGKLAT